MPDLYAQLHNRQLEATNLSAKWPFKKQTKRNNQKHPNTPPHPTPPVCNCTSQWFCKDPVH